MAEFKVGSAYVEVHARGQDRVVPETERALRAGSSRFQAAGLGAGQAYADGVTRGADGRLRAASGRFVAAGTAAGRGYGDGLGRGVQSGARKATSALLGVTAGAARTAAMLGAVSVAGAAAGAALAALPALGAGVGAMGATVALAFNGVGDALKGYTADQDAAGAAGVKSASSAKSNARAIRDAASGIDDARRQQARTARDSAEAVEKAEARVREAADDTAAAVAEAKARQTKAARESARDIAAADEALTQTLEDNALALDGALERVTDAEEREREALDGLNAARAEAGRQLDDLREKVKDYALNEKAAELAVRVARTRLETSNKDITKSALQRELAAQELAEAEERLSDLQRERARDSAELAQAEKAGVDGSKRVVAAQEQVATAHDAVSDARKAQQRTIRDTAKQEADDRERVAQAVSEAAERQREAAAEVTRAAVEGAKREQEAEEDLDRTRRDAAEANQDAARASADAMQGLADVQDQQGESAATAAKKTSQYADAMAKLNPEQRELVRQLLAMKPLVDGLARTASRTFLPGFTQMLRDSEGLFPIFDAAIERTGTIMGNAARKMGELFKSEEFKTNLDRLFKAADPITRAITDGFVAGTDRLVEFGANMAPVAEGFATFLRGVGRGVDGFFTALEPRSDDFKLVWESLGRIAEVVLPAMGEVIGRIAEVVAPVLEKLAGFLERNKEDIDDWILGVGGLILAVKGIGVAVAAATWVKKVMGLFDGLGGSAKRNRDEVDKLGDSVRNGGSSGKGKPKLSKGAKAAGVLGVAALGAGAIEGGASETKGLGALGETLGAAGGLDLSWFGQQLRAEVEYAPKAWADIKRWWGEGSDWIAGKTQGSGTTIRTDMDKTGGKWTWLDETIVQPATRQIGAIWRWLNDNVITPVSNGIRTSLQWVGEKFTWLRDNVVNPVANGIRGTLQWLNDNVVNPVSTSIRGTLQWVGDKFQWLKDSAAGHMQWLGDRIRWVKDTLIQPVLDGLRSGVDGVGRAFESVAAWIGRSWDSIKEKARQPAQWVVDVVYNNGIRKVWNGIATTFGMGQLNEVHFARGGLVPGQDRGVDYVPALLRGGEGVLVPEAVRAVGGAEGIERLNRAAERQRFARGGVAGTSTSASASVTKASGSVQGTTAAGSFLMDLFSDATGSVRRLFAGVLGDAGRTPGSGGFRDALVKLPTLVMDKVIEKAKSFAVSAVPAAGGAGVQRWAPLVLQALGMMGQPASLLQTVLRRMNQESGGNPNIVNNWDSNAARGTPSGGLMQTILPTFRAYHFPGTSNNMFDPLANILASMRYAMARYGSLPAAYNKAGGYDQGGLANGVGMLPKYTPEPERVLSPRQTESFERLVDHLTANGGRTSGDRPVVVNVQQTSGSPAETGRFVALALRSA